MKNSGKTQAMTYKPEQTFLWGLLTILVTLAVRIVVWYIINDQKRNGILFWECAKLFFLNIPKRNVLTAIILTKILFLNQSK